MENTLESVSSPKEETGLQGNSQLCIDTKHNTKLPDNIVTGVTLQLPISLLRQQHNQKVGTWLYMP